MLDFLDHHGAWNSQLLSEFFWEMDVAEILKMCTSPSERQDFIAWQPERNGSFLFGTLAMADHEEAFGNGASSSNSDGNSTLWNLIW